MKIKAGKSYQIKIPNFGFTKRKVHIDYILDNPVCPDCIDEFKIIVYRTWHKRKHYWVIECCRYYTLCMYNDWEYNKKEVLGTN